MTPFTTILVPCYNEEKYIEKLLDNILQQDFPKDFMEVIISDGNSTDRTRDIICEYKAKHPEIILLDNPARFVSFGLNDGIRHAKGDVIVRMDAHAEYPANYVSRLVSCLFELNADNVGGSWITAPGDSRLKSLAIAQALSSPFGIGNAQYRLNVKKIRKVDTVPFGCFHKSIFEEIGFFDEELFRNQDIEFNGRILKNGGSIYLVPDVKITYYARSSIRNILKMFIQYSMFRPLVNKKLKKTLQPRQFVPPVWLVFLIVTFIGAFFSRTSGVILFCGLGLYLIFDVSFSIQSCVNTRKWELFLYLPWIYFFFHLAYGYGYIRGIIKFTLFRQKPNQISSTR